MNGERFLNELYKELNVSEEVLHSSNGSKNKNEAVKKYMNRLEKIHNLASKNEKKELLKDFYHKKYVVKKEDIPFGFNKNKIIKDQEESLDKWIDYLSDDGARYPIWAKYWAFQGMLKIGTYNEEKDIYQKRSKKTLAPFIEINPEVLSKCIEMVVESLDNEKISDSDIKRIVMEKGNFQKIYTILLKKSQKELFENSNILEGIWKRYHHETEQEANKKEEQGLEPEYLKLYKSLNGYNTGWCTAGSKNTAKQQICGGRKYIGGDFYVYYTKNEIGEYKIPRIAIRMDKDEIGEIRGIQDDQNLEEGLEEVVEKKLKDLNLKVEKIKEYSEIISNLKMLTILNRKQKNDIEFSKEELNFIYEVYDKIKNFGWSKDSRIDKIKQQRDFNTDLKNMDYNERIIAAKNNIYEFEKISSDIEGYKEIAINAINKRSNVFENIPSTVYGYGEIALEAVKKDGRLLRCVPKDIENYREIAVMAVNNSGTALEYVPKDIENYREIVIMAVNNDGWALKYVPKNIENYREIAVMAVNNSGTALEYVPKDIENYREIAVMAVNNSGTALEYVPKDIDNYKEIALAAVKNSSFALEFVPTSMEEYKDIALIAVKDGTHYDDFYILDDIPKNIEGYKEIAIEALNVNSDVFYSIPSSVEGYKDIAIAFIKKDPYKILDFSKSDSIYKEIAIEAVRKVPMLLKRIPMSVEGYEEIAMEAKKTELIKIANKESTKLESLESSNMHL